MSGMNKLLIFTTALALLSSPFAVYGQDTNTPGPPQITGVTPGDQSATILFIPGTAGVLPVVEYVAACEMVGNADAGIVEVTVDATDSNSLVIDGLPKNAAQRCTLAARSLSDGVIPRAFTSVESNPTPIFTPNQNGGPTIFVSQPVTAPAPQQPAPVPVEAPIIDVPVIMPTEPVAVPPPMTEEPIILPAPLPRVLITSVSSVEDDITIRFRPAAAAQDAAPITGFTASCSSNTAVSSSDGQAQSSPVQVAADALEATIKGLAPGEYTCSVAAETEQGTGPASSRNIFVATLVVYEAPTAPVPAPTPVPVPAPTPAPVPAPGPISGGNKAIVSVFVLAVSMVAALLA